MAIVEYTFGNCRLDINRRDLWRDEARVTLGPTPVGILVYLIENRERFVRANELFEKKLLRKIEEVTIRGHVHAINKSLRGAASIVNDRHAGYKFTCDDLREVGTRDVSLRNPRLIRFDGDHVPESGTWVEPRQIPPGTKWAVEITDSSGTRKFTRKLTATETIDGRQVYLLTSGRSTMLVDVATHNDIGWVLDGKMMWAVTPHEGLLSWPLSLGKTWNASFSYKDYEKEFDLSVVTSQYRVTRFEEVTVPAGTFTALRIEGTPLLNESVTRTAWYAPLPGILVRRSSNRRGEIDYRGTSFESVIELQTYPTPR